MGATVEGTGLLSKKMLGFLPNIDLDCSQLSTESLISLKIYFIARKKRHESFPISKTVEV